MQVRSKIDRVNRPCAVGREDPPAALSRLIALNQLLAEDLDPAFKERPTQDELHCRLEIHDRGEAVLIYACRDGPHLHRNNSNRVRINVRAGKYSE